MFNTDEIIEAIEEYAQSDVQELIRNRALPKGMRIKDILVSETDSVYIYVAEATISYKGRQYSVSCEYEYDDENLEIYSEDVDTMLTSLLKQISSDRPINSSTKIMAADTDDPDDTILDEQDSFEESLDAVGDQLDEMQESIDDAVEEDDVNIEIDNNIDNHYIAECEKCKGVFISAVMQTEEDIKEVTGTCPLCSKETTQYLKWVVSKVDRLGGN